MVAVTVAAVERDEHVRPEGGHRLLDRLEDVVDRRADQRAGAGLALHAGVAEAEQVDAAHAEQPGRLAQLGLPQLGEPPVRDRHPVGHLAGLAAGRAGHGGHGARPGGVEEQRAAAERLVVGMGDHDLHAEQRAAVAGDREHRSSFGSCHD